MPTVIKIPESLQFYFDSDQNASAVNQILDSESIPLELSWQEVELYNTAKVSAQVTKLDYWKFLKEIWQYTWGSTLNNLNLKEVDKDYYDYEYSMDNVWSEHYLYKTFEFKDSFLYLFSRLTDASSIQIGFFIKSQDETFELSNSIILQDGWNISEDDERWTKEDIACVRDRTEIDIHELIQLSEEALKSIDKI